MLEPVCKKHNSNIVKMTSYRECMCCMSLCMYPNEKRAQMFQWTKFYMDCMNWVEMIVSKQWCEVYAHAMCVCVCVSRFERLSPFLPSHKRHISLWLWHVFGQNMIICHLAFAIPYPFDNVVKAFNSVNEHVYNISEHSLPK